MRRVAVLLLVTGFAGAGGRVDAAAHVSQPSAAERPVSPAPRVSYAGLPAHFEPNRGQTDPSVRFLGRARGYRLFLCGADAICAPLDGDPIRMTFVGGSEHAALVVTEPTGGRSHYFQGNDPSCWVTDVDHYRGVSIDDVWPGIDVRWRAVGSVLEYDFVVAPGADASSIRLRFEGARSVEVDDDGSLRVVTSTGEFRHAAPVMSQRGRNGTVYVAGGFLVRDDGSVALSVGTYDVGRELVIDPVVTYSTYVGGSGGEADNGRGGPIAVDGSGAVIVAGNSRSLNFATSGAAQTTHAGDDDALVVKLNAAGSAILWATYLGGTGLDQPSRLAVDSGGAVYVCGSTMSNNFPTQAPLQASLGGSTDAFVTKLSASGSSLTWSTYLGGSGGAAAWGIAVDSSGATYVTGGAGGGFPTTPGAFQTARAGSNDAFVAKIDSSGASLAYSTYLGGATAPGTSATDYGTAIAVDSSGAAYVVGQTASTDFPVQSPIQATIGGSGSPGDGFVSKIAPSGASLVYSTYLGGSGAEYARAIAVDASGAVVVAGMTNSTDFPLRSPLQAANAGQYDVFVTKINASGSAFAFSTYVGGSGKELSTGMTLVAVALDAAGAVYVAGSTQSADFPTQRAIQASIGGGEDAFVLKFASTGQALTWSTFLGGGGNERATGIAVDSAGAVYVVGTTASTNFPTTSPLQANHGGGGEDLFVVKVAAPAAPAAPTGLVAAAPDDESVVLSWTDVAEEAGYEVERADGAGPFVQVASAGEDGVAYTDESVTGDTAYAYRVRAVNAVGASSYSGTATLTTPPRAPADAAAAPLSDTRVDVRWTDVSGMESRYRVERRTVGSNEFTLVGTTGADATTLPDSSVAPETSYDYRVRAENDRGNSVWTGAAAVRSAPAAPTPLVPRTTSDTSVTVTWVDLSAEETGYELQRGVGWPGRDFVLLRILPPGSTMFVDDTVEPETTYAYRVRALGETAPSGWSAEMRVTTPPYAPTGVVAEPLSPSRLLVRWTDRAAAEDSFVLRRTELPDGVPLTLATVGANVTEFEDATAGPDTGYVYGVCAVDANGTSAEALGGETRTPSALIVSRIRIQRPKAAGRGRTKPARMTIAGSIDAGARALDLGGPTAFAVGEAVFDLPGLAAKGGGRRFDGPDLVLVLKPSKASVGRVAFEANLVGDGVASLDPDEELVVRYENGEFRAWGAVRLSADRFEPSKGIGRHVDPSFTVADLSVSLATGRKDTVRLRGTFDTGGGLPVEPPEVTVTVGAMDFRAPPEEFRVRGGKLIFAQNVVGARKVVLDYDKGRFTASLGSVELGVFEDGVHPVVVEVSVGEVHFRSTLYLTAKGKSLRY